MADQHVQETDCHPSLRAHLERLAAPGYGWCDHCGRPWKYVEGHMTQYTETRSCFPLCEACWTALGSPEARLPYYRMLWNRWLGDGDAPDPTIWDRIEAAVRAGR